MHNEIEDVKLPLLLEEFLFELKTKNYSGKTVETYFYNTRMLIDFLAERGVTYSFELRVRSMREFIAHLQAKGYKPNYINIVMKSVRAFVKYLLTEGYVETNPMRGITSLKEAQEVIQTFTESEVARMLSVYSYKSYLEARNKLIVAFFVETGIRLSELINLQETCVEESVIRILGKGNKWRYVPISPQLKKMILRYKRIRQSYIERIEASSGNFFLSRSGEPLSTVMVEIVVKKAGEKAGVRESLRCSPHTFRHYALQSYLKQGLDVYSVSRLAGHANISITNRYLLGLKHEDIMDRASSLSPIAYANKNSKKIKRQ